MAQLIVANFTDSGVPKTGLSPLIDIFKVSDNTLLIDDAAMTEIGGGWYKYNFTTYDPDIDIVFICDGTATLGNSDRYVFGGNDDPQQVGTKTIKTHKIQKNRWLRNGTQWIFYDDDGTTELFKFDLKDKNGAAAGEEDVAFERVPV